MKRLNRLTAPGHFADGQGGNPAARKEWYKDIYKADGKTIKDRWNSIDLDAADISAIRRSLETMSDGLCAWCEQLLQSGWHVDHWLPKIKFPLVCYCPDNLLPACASCNRRKDAVVPPGLKGKVVVDPVLISDYPEHIPFLKDQLYPILDDRLIDPSFEDPATHLEFVAAALSFRGLTKAGIFTVNIMFAGKEGAKLWSMLHSWVEDLMKDLATSRISRDVFDRLIRDQIGFLGRPTIINALVAHWSAFYR